jgi:hypothetical protein
MGRRFTGIIDINGRKIYTGDTVKMHYFEEVHSLSGAYEADVEVIGVVGHSWGKYYTVTKKRTYINGKLVEYEQRYYWKTYLQEPEEELEVIS